MVLRVAEAVATAGSAHEAVAALQSVLVLQSVVELQSVVVLQSFGVLVLVLVRVSLASGDLGAVGLDAEF